MKHHNGLPFCVHFWQKIKTGAGCPPSSLPPQYLPLGTGGGTSFTRGAKFSAERERQAQRGGGAYAIIRAGAGYGRISRAHIAPVSHATVGRCLLSLPPPERIGAHRRAAAGVFSMGQGNAAGAHRVPQRRQKAGKNGCIFPPVFPPNRRTFGRAACVPAMRARFLAALPPAGKSPIPSGGIPRPPGHAKNFPHGRHIAGCRRIIAKTAQKVGQLFPLIFPL